MTRRGAAVVLAALALAGCTASDPVEPSPEPTAASAESAAPVEPACPESLPVPLGAESFESWEREPAASSPTFAAFDSAWACIYFGAEPPEGGSVPVEIPDGELDALDAWLAELVPAEAVRPCTLDYGPTVLLVLATGQEQTGLAVETYGCHDAYLTGDPWDDADEPADGLVAGTLAVSQELADAARAWTGRG